MAALWIGIPRFRWLPPVAVVTAFCAAGLLWQWHGRSDGHNRTSAQLDLVMISESLKSLSADSAVAISQDSITNLNARVLYGLLSATNAGAFLLEHEKEWDRRRELVDPWGRPFHMQLVDPKTDTACTDLTTVVGVKIWSVGPNGKDEQGTGDDIASQTVAIRLRK